MLTISKSIPIIFVLDGSGVASGSLPPPFLLLTEYPVYAFSRFKDRYITDRMELIEVYYIVSLTLQKRPVGRCITLIRAADRGERRILM